MAKTHAYISNEMQLQNHSLTFIHKKKSFLFYHSSILVIEKNCPLHIIKDLSTLDSNFASEMIIEKCMQTVHVLVAETELVQFL